MKLDQDSDGLALSCFKYFKDGDPMSSLEKAILSAEECFSYAYVGHLLLQFVNYCPFLIFAYASQKQLACP